VRLSVAKAYQNSICERMKEQDVKPLRMKEQDAKPLRMKEQDAKPQRIKVQDAKPQRIKEQDAKPQRIKVQNAKPQHPHPCSMDVQCNVNTEGNNIAFLFLAAASFISH